MDLAACRSALIRNKIVMRFGCCLVAMSMIMSCWATPKAKAVASESALLGSIFGSLLVSMGYSWVADNMDVPTFGESIYKLTQEFDEAMKDTGNQLIRDLNLAGLTANGAGKLQFGYAWVQAARSFAEWFQSKFLSNNTSAVVSSSPASIALKDGGYFYLMQWNGVTGENRKDQPVGGTKIFYNDVFEFANGAKLFSKPNEKDNGAYYLWFRRPSGQQVSISYFKSNDDYVFLYLDGTNRLYECYYYSNLGYCTKGGEIPLDWLTLNSASKLTVEKPQEIHYPDVAEDGSQVYEITVDGVTATDIEGIIQGAVDRILAGTAAIAGELVQAQDVPAEPEAPPELDGLDLPALGAALTTRFPFSIPWDVARGIEMLAAPAEAPYWEVDFLAPLGYRVGGWKGSTMVVLDFSQFEVIGQVTRWMSTIGFCLMLASSTKRLIWVA